MFGDGSIASESVFPWDDADAESRSSSNHGDGSGSQGGDPRPGAGYLGALVTALMDRVTELEASMNSAQELSRRKDQSLAKKFASLSAENSQLRLSLQKAREESVCRSRIRFRGCVCSGRTGRGQVRPWSICY